MPRFRYQLDGKWYKGNTHTHSLESDGSKTTQELGLLYRRAGYDFLCLTDHWVASQMEPAFTEDGLLWINGVELHGEDAAGTMYHYVALGDFSHFDRHSTLEESLEAVRAQDGFLILAHPFWMGLNFEQSWRYPVDAVEVYNHLCWRENGKGDSLVFWHQMLEGQGKALAIACDDAHFLYEPPAWRGGWLMVNAFHCTRSAILNALRAGRYYSSCGPVFSRISYLNDVLHVETSPVRMIRLVGPATHGRAVSAQEGQTITSATFELPGDWPYAYLEIEDNQRRRAWTNTLFTD
jgi:hypothetical protein